MYGEIKEKKIEKDIKRYVDLHFKEIAAPLQLGVYKYSTRMDHSKKKFRCLEIEKKSLMSLFENLFMLEEYRIIYKIFGIEPVLRKIKISFEDLPKPNDEGEIKGILFEKVPRFKFISAINKIEVDSTLLSTGKNVTQECEMRTDIISVDNFGCNIVCQMQLNINYATAVWEIMESTQSYIMCEIYGVESNREYPIWIEYLLISYIFFEMNNEKMAFFTAFSALDHFIERLYLRLPLVYQAVYFENIKDITDRDAQILDSKRSIYSNNNRRLVDEKLHDILRERFDDDKFYSTPYSKIKIYEKCRNKIAHCENINVEGKYLDLLLNIFKIMYLAGLGTDIIKVLEEEQ